MIKVGDRVQYIGGGHEKEPQFYPECGTTGVVKCIVADNAIVQWKFGSTSYGDCWCCCLEHLIKEDKA